MSGKTYGYVRVSSRGQNEDRQLVAMREFGVPAERIVVEKQSGKNFERPLYLSLIQGMDRGDVLVVKSIDRLGRNYKEILEQWATLTKERALDWWHGRISAVQARKKLGVSRTTFTSRAEEWCQAAEMGKHRAALRCDRRPRD